MNEITTVGVDLAKDVIVVCAADASGRTVFFKQLGFRGFAEWAANLLPCTIAMEACSSAHYWARTLSALGHRPKLLAPDLVQPFRKSKGAKNDRNDAQAILIAALQQFPTAHCFRTSDVNRSKTLRPKRRPRFQLRSHQFVRRSEARVSLTSNGEVEGPDDHAGQAPRAHTVFQRPRRQTDHASRPPPTIVRPHGHHQ